MDDKQSFDKQADHRCFAAQYFNLAWDLIEKTNRTEEEDREMTRVAHASRWH